MAKVVSDEKKNEIKVKEAMASDTGTIRSTLDQVQQSFVHAFRVSTPLIGVATPDIAATKKWAVALAKNSNLKHSFFTWDVVHGLRPTTTDSEKAYKRFIDKLVPGAGKGTNDQETREEVLAKTADLSEMLKNFEQLDEYSSVFVHNIHLYWEFPPIIEALFSLRNVLKAKSCSLVLLAPSFSGKIPAELQHDIVVFEEELPTRVMVTGIVENQIKTLIQQSSGVFKHPGEEQVERITNYLSGMSAYAVEQSLSLAARKDGIDFSLLATQKKQRLESVPGLKFESWKIRFNEIGGLRTIIPFIQDYMNGAQPPKLIVRIDEMEKYLGGTGGENGQGDTSGVSQDALGVLLQNMSDNGWVGMIFAGVPGSGKSLVSKAISGEYNLPLVSLDMGAARGSLVGQSEQNIRNQMKTLRGMAGEDMGGALIIATCNRIASLPVELKRRFILGTWMFDLPTEEELAPIWQINLKKYGLAEKGYQPLDVLHLTGADVHNICYLSYCLRKPLEVAYQYISPVWRTDKEAVMKLQMAATDHFLSASYPGLYVEPGEAEKRRLDSMEEGERRVELE